MKLRRDLATILLIALLSVALAHVTYAQVQPAPNQPPSKWDLGYPVQVVAILAAILIAGAGALLFFVARKPGDSFIFKMRPSFFFWLGMTYTMLLTLAAIIYNVSYTGPHAYLLGNMLPIAVPWFGALGAVTISLEGVFQWSESRWNPEYNYWHLGRPFFGAVLGTVGFFLFVLIVSSSGTTPKFLDNPTDATTPAKDFIIYYVVAFLAGYREETFRELIRRVTDMILKPAVQSSVAAPQVSFRHDGVAQTDIGFPETAVGERAQMNIEILNSSSVPLVAPTLTVTGTDSTPKEGVFVRENDNVTGTKELGPNQIGKVDITFVPPTPGTYTGVLSVAATNLMAPATIKVAGSGSPKKPQVVP